MANIGHGKKFEQMKEKLLKVAQKEFFINGYKNTKIAGVCKTANVDNNAVARVFCDKETLFLSVIEQVIKEQNKIVKKLLRKTKDNLLEYFLLSAIKLIFSTLSEQSRENFKVYYEKKKANVDKKLYEKLKESLPQNNREDFYACSLAIDGIMSNFISSALALEDKINKFTLFSLSILNIESDRAKQIIEYLENQETINIIEKHAHNLLQSIKEN